jgi:hypothetical protein
VIDGLFGAYPRCTPRQPPQLRALPILRLRFALA